MSRRFLVAGVGVLLTAVLGVYATTGLLRIQRMRGEIAAAEREIDALRARQRSLSEEIWRLRNDPAYLERLAREERGLVREGETVLKFPPKGR